MPGAENKKATPVTNFRITFGGLESVSMFREWSGFSSSFSPVEDTVESDAFTPMSSKFPMGSPDWEPIKVERSLDTNMDLYTWFKECNVDGKFEDVRKEGTVELLNHKGEAILKYKIVDAWPAEYTISDFDAAEMSPPATETLTIVHAGLERI